MKICRSTIYANERFEDILIAGVLEYMDKVFIKINPSEAICLTNGDLWKITKESLVTSYQSAYVILGNPK